MSIKVLSSAKISPSLQSQITKETINLLEINPGDEILFILSNDNVIIRKFKGEIILREGEKYLSSSKVMFIPDYGIRTHISADIIKLINSNIGDNILWLLAENRDIIIKNNIILGECSKELFNKDIIYMVIGLTKLIYYANSYMIGLPREIIEILGDSRDIIFLCRYVNDNIIISKEPCKELLDEQRILEYARVRLFTLIGEIRDILNINVGDKILWIYDEEGNIIIRNAILPDNCLV